MIDAVLTGFSVALLPQNLMFCFIGCLIGTLVGVLPGLGPVAAISILLPTTFNISPVSSIIMLAGIYYGAMYGGSITSILVNMPGEAASVITCRDGYQMARKGRAGAALGISAIGSFIGGTVSVILLMVVAEPLAGMALAFGPPEYFALMTIGLVVVTFLAGKSMVKSLLMAVVGLFLGCIGMDTFPRNRALPWGSRSWTTVWGWCRSSWVFTAWERSLQTSRETSPSRSLRRKLKISGRPKEDIKRSMGAILRGTGLGFILGILPGGGAVLASFVSYGMEKKLSKHPEEFGQGAIEGVAGPETANNAATGGAFIPLFHPGLAVQRRDGRSVGSHDHVRAPSGPADPLHRPELSSGA